MRGNIREQVIFQGMNRLLADPLERPQSYDTLQGRYITRHRCIGPQGLGTGVAEDTPDTPASDAHRRVKEVQCRIYEISLEKRSPAGYGKRFMTGAKHCHERYP
ncbi:MAG: hypothetical protein Kow0077_09550 [Anaerolineae bacterium]